MSYSCEDLEDLGLMFLVSISRPLSFDLSWITSTLCHFCIEEREIDERLQMKHHTLCVAADARSFVTRHSSFYHHSAIYVSFLVSYNALGMVPLTYGKSNLRQLTICIV